MLEEKAGVEENTEETKDEAGEEPRLGLGASDADDYIVSGTEPDPDEEKYASQYGLGKAPRRRYFAAFISGFACCLALVLLAAFVPGLGRIVTNKSYKYYRELDRDYGKFHEVMKFIEEDPIAEKEPEQIGDEELKRIVSGIGDPYAEYFTAQEYEEVEKRYLGNYIGIGVGVVEEDGRVVVKSVFEDSPAEEDGFKEGDIIVKVDGREPSGMDDAIELITGEAGTKVVIELERDGETLEIETRRAKIDTHSVGYSPLKEDPSIGYIRISSFIKGTKDEFKLAVRDLESEGCDRFILDLRNNGGGLTKECIGIADYLLPACRIMSEVKKDGSEKVFNSKAGSAGLELVVLVNGDTASASEILTAAIQDNKAGTVIGTKTYGKGVTQLSHKFRDGSALKITETEYFRPDGSRVNGEGITPDIEAEGEDALDEALRVLAK